MFTFKLFETKKEKLAKQANKEIQSILTEGQLLHSTPFLHNDPVNDIEGFMNEKKERDAEYQRLYERITDSMIKPH